MNKKVLITGLILFMMLGVSAFSYTALASKTKTHGSPAVAGVISLISGAEVTITARDGSQQNVDTTNFTFYKGSRAATSSLSDIAIGDSVLLRGKSIIFSMAKLNTSTTSRTSFERAHSIQKNRSHNMIFRPLKIKDTKIHQDFNSDTSASSTASTSPIIENTATSSLDDATTSADVASTSDVELTQASTSSSSSSDNSL
jgi:hypothetical protein